MPVYEYECPVCQVRFDRLEPMRSGRPDETYYAICSECGCVSPSVMSKYNWSMGWKFLKDKSEKSPAAPTNSGNYPAWDEAYQGPQVKPKASPL